jgi:hypothetical protein
MSRTLITFAFAWLITRLFYLLSRFEPIRDIKGLPGYAVDLAIWLAVSMVIFWCLGVLGIGKKPQK